MTIRPPARDVELSNFVSFLSLQERILGGGGERYRFHDAVWDLVKVVKYRSATSMVRTQSCDSI